MPMPFDEDSFKIKYNNVVPAKGSILISEPFLIDSYFQRAVVFLAEHSTEGSMGFVLNKNLDISLSELIKDLTVKQHIPVFLGGPVNVDTLFFLHNLPFIPQSHPISDTLFLNGDFDFLKDYINAGGEIDGKIKFFFGYSGWNQNQLTEELKENAWLVGSIPEIDTLQTNTVKVWEKALASLGEKYKKWTKFPKDPSLN